MYSEKHSMHGFFIKHNFKISICHQEERDYGSVLRVVNDNIPRKLEQDYRPHVRASFKRQSSLQSGLFVLLTYNVLKSINNKLSTVEHYKLKQFKIKYMYSKQ